MLRLSTCLFTICTICALFYICKIWNICAIFLAPNKPSWVKDLEILRYLISTHAVWLRKLCVVITQPPFWWLAPDWARLHPWFFCVSVFSMPLCDLQATFKLGYIGTGANSRSSTTTIVPTLLTPPASPHLQYIRLHLPGLFPYILV